MTSAHLLLEEEARIVINWYGGWHHAKRYIISRILIHCPEFKSGYYPDVEIQLPDIVTVMISSWRYYDYKHTFNAFSILISMFTMATVK